MSAAAGQAELHTFSLIKNLHRLVRGFADYKTSKKVWISQRDIPT